MIEAFGEPVYNYRAEAIRCAPSSDGPYRVVAEKGSWFFAAQARKNDLALAALRAISLSSNNQVLRFRQVFGTVS